MGFTCGVMQQSLGDTGAEEADGQREPGQQAAVMHGFWQRFQQHDAANAQEDEAVEDGAEFALAVQPGIGQGAEQQREQAGGKNDRMHRPILRRAGRQAPTQTDCGCGAVLGPLS